MCKFEVLGVDSGRWPSVKSKAGFNVSVKTGDNTFRHFTSTFFHIAPSYITHKCHAISHWTLRDFNSWYRIVKEHDKCGTGLC
jgi:hypothetical protein